MNNKVVIVWICAVAVLFVIGIFGYFNQDLLNPEKPSAPSIDTSTKTFFCNRVSPTFRSIYKFDFDGSSDELKTVSMSYINNSNIDDDNFYKIAKNIRDYVNNNQVAGITTNLSGEINTFTFTIELDLANFEETSINLIKDNLLTLDMVLAKIYSYEEYQDKIVLELNKSYNCD